MPPRLQGPSPLDAGPRVPDDAPGPFQEVGLSHDSGFRRKEHDVSSSHKQRAHRDHASKVFEERIRQQQKARERTLNKTEVVSPGEDSEG